MIIPPVILILTMPFFLVAEYRATRRVQVLPLKLLCSLCFVATGGLGILLAGGTTNRTYDSLMLAGLLLSLLGDLALVWKDSRKAFTLGLGAFLVAQVVFGAAFSLVNGLSVWDLPLFTALFLGPVAASRYLDLDVGQMKIPVLAYLLVIAFMFSKALSSLYLHGFTPPADWLIPLGAGLFFASDGFLALFKFQRKKIQPFRAVNLITYYAGQVLLALSIFYF